MAWANGWKMAEPADRLWLTDPAIANRLEDGECGGFG
jgi:hypothetical protein